MSVARTPEYKRQWMAERRKDPEVRARWNASRRGKYKREQQHYRLKMRDRHFFRWRARLWSNRWKVSVTASDLARLWIAQHGQCALSGQPLGRDAHLDHIVPLTADGTHGIDNLRWLDPWVNIARRNLSDEEFVRRCNAVIEWIGRRMMAVEAQEAP